MNLLNKLLLITLPVELVVNTYLESAENTAFVQKPLFNFNSNRSYLDLADNIITLPMQYYNNDITHFIVKSYIIFERGNSEFFYVFIKFLCKKSRREFLYIFTF